MSRSRSNQVVETFRAAFEAAGVLVESEEGPRPVGRYPGLVKQGFLGIRVSGSGSSLAIDAQEHHVDVTVETLGGIISYAVGPGELSGMFRAVAEWIGTVAGEDAASDARRVLARGAQASHSTQLTRAFQ